MSCQMWDVFSNYFLRFFSALPPPSSLSGTLMTQTYIIPHRPVKLYSVFFLFLKRNFWLYCAACGVLIPQPGIETAPPAEGAPSLNHGTAREVHFFPFIKLHFLLRYNLCNIKVAALTILKCANQWC